MFISKIRFAVGLAGFLLAGSLSSYAYDMSGNQRLTQDNNFLSKTDNIFSKQQKKSTKTQEPSLTNSSLSLNPNFNLQPVSCNQNSSISCQTTPSENSLPNNQYQPYQPQLLSQAYPSFVTFVRE